MARSDRQAPSVERDKRPEDRPASSVQRHQSYVRVKPAADTVLDRRYRLVRRVGRGQIGDLWRIRRANLLRVPRFGWI